MNQHSATRNDLDTKQAAKRDEVARIEREKADLDDKVADLTAQLRAAQNEGYAKAAQLTKERIAADVLQRETELVAQAEAELQETLADIRRELAKKLTGLAGLSHTQ